MRTTSRIRPKCVICGTSKIAGGGVVLGYFEQAGQRLHWLAQIVRCIGEELGLRFTWLVVFCFIMIILCGGLIAANAKDRFGKLLALGIILLISLQAAVNIGMTTSLLPNKGMPLPFISYGGSNLAVCLFMIGILVNIHRIGIPIAPLPERHVVLAARSVPRI